jgi:hypothetical protein
VQKRSLSPIAQTLLACLCLFIATFAYKYQREHAVQLTIEQLPQELPAAIQPPAEEATPEPTHFGSSKPEQTVLEIISKLKSDQDPTVILDYVWWDAAFARLSDSQKKYLSVGSPGALRRYYQEFYTNPNMAIVREAAKRAENLPPEKRQQLYEFYRKQEKISLPAPRYTRVLHQLYEIKGESISGGSAEVELLVSEQAKSETKKINLIKVQDRWMLSCFQVIDDPLKLCK